MVVTGIILWLLSRNKNLDSDVGLSRKKKKDDLGPFIPPIQTEARRVFESPFPTIRYQTPLRHWPGLPPKKLRLVSGSTAPPTHYTPHVFFPTALLLHEAPSKQPHPSTSRPQLGPPALLRASSTNTDQDDPEVPGKDTPPAKSPYIHQAPSEKNGKGRGNSTSPEKKRQHVTPKGRRSVGQRRQQLGPFRGRH